MNSQRLTELMQARLTESKFVDRLAENYRALERQFPKPRRSLFERFRLFLLRIGWWPRG